MANTSNTGASTRAILGAARKITRTIREQPLGKPTGVQAPTTGQLWPRS